MTDETRTDSPEIHFSRTAEEVCISMGDIARRLTYLGDYHEAATGPLPASMLAEEIGTNVRWVYRAVKEFGIAPESGAMGGVAVPCYPSFTLPLLRDELEWRREWQALPSLLTITQLAEGIGRSWVWTNNTIGSIGIKHSATEMRSSRESKLYRKGVLKKLREVSVQFALDDGWPNTDQLVISSGEDREWVVRRLREAGVKPEIRRSALTGKLLEHWPIEAYRLINIAKADRAPEAEAGWTTAESIPEQVGRSYNWCKARLGLYSNLTEVRQDAQGVDRIHYPQSVVEALRAERDSIEEYPDAGDYLTPSKIAIKMGKSKLWVNNRLASVSAGEMRKDGKGRVRLHFLPTVIDELKALPDDLRAG